MLAVLLFLIHGASGQAADDKAKNLAHEAQNPIANMISVPFQFNTNLGIGPHERTQNVLSIQPVIPIDLSDDWLLVTRWVLPVIDQPDVQESSGRTFGLGDLSPAFWFTPSSRLIGLPEEWMIGFGPGAQVPTATDSDLGAREFQGR